MGLVRMRAWAGQLTAPFTSSSWLAEGSKGWRYVSRRANASSVTFQRESVSSSHTPDGRSTTLCTGASRLTRSRPPSAVTCPSVSQRPHPVPRKNLPIAFAPKPNAVKSSQAQYGLNPINLFGLLLKPAFDFSTVGVPVALRVALEQKSLGRSTRFSQTDTQIGKLAIMKRTLREIHRQPEARYVRLKFPLLESGAGGPDRWCLSTSRRRVRYLNRIEGSREEPSADASPRPWGEFCICR